MIEIYVFFNDSSIFAASMGAALFFMGSALIFMIFILAQTPGADPIQVYSQKA